MQGLIDKKQNSVLDKIKLFIDYYGTPDQFWTDNGKEFNNASLINYLFQNNIKLINDAPITQDLKV